MDTRVAAVTVRVALPVTEPQPLVLHVAVMIAFPVLTAAASPLPSMVAAATLDEDQVTSAVRFWGGLLEKVPVAMNAWVVPAAMDAEAGITLMDTRVAAVTTSVVPVLCPWKLAVRVAEPASTPTALPVAAPMVATAVLEELQAALAVTSVWLPSLEIAVAGSCTQGAAATGGCRVGAGGWAGACDASSWQPLRATRPSRITAVTDLQAKNKPRAGRAA